MARQTLQRVLVWSGRLRLAHWSMAAAVLTLLASGWLLVWLPALYEPLRSIHLGAGYVLGAALALRIYLLLFGRAAEHWRDLVPRGPQVRAMWDVLRFYLSLGRAPLPAWYAHNPLWAPLYAVLLALLLAQTLSGLGYDHAAARAWHSLLAPPIAILVAAHLVAVFVHDLKGGGADVSAMINGHRLFRTEASPALGAHEVSLQELLRRAPKSAPGGAGDDRNERP